MTHYEVFQVLTDPHGGSDMSFRIACATAGEHYARTVTHTHDAASSAAETEVCSTGLRVYAGAQVLAAFLVQFGDALVHLSTACSLASTSSSLSAAPVHTTVELGCGCGLAGFTLSTIVQRADHSDARALVSSPSAPLQSLRVVFTDASTDCLALVREGGTLNAMEVLDGTCPADGFAARVTYPLDWGPEGVAALARDVLTDDTGPVDGSQGASVELVIGSDLLYYRVDIVQLLDTCKRLLFLRTDAEVDNDQAAGVFKVVVLSHFMRIADGERKVAEAARAMGLGVVCVPLTRFLDTSVVFQSSFQGLELILLFPITAPTEAPGDRPATDETETDETETTVLERETRRGQQDVAQFQKQLHKVVQSLSTTSSTTRTRAWRASLTALSACVDIYGLSASASGTAQGVAEEENALLHILCDL